MEFLGLNTKMTTQIQNKGIEVKEARTTLTVPHLNSKLTFAYPIKGPGNYIDVKKQIDNDRTPSQLYRPTTAETISLIHSAFQDKDNKYSQEILRILRERYFWCFTKNLWTPKGVYVVDDKDGSKLNSKDLEKRLEQNDKSVRFVPNSFKLGEQSVEEFEKNHFVIAHAGEEGAQKSAEIASKLERKPFVYGLEGVTGDTERVTGLSSGWLGGRLGFDGEFFGVDMDGCAFGVQK